MNLDYLLTGLVNGSYLEVRGSGEINTSRGGFNLDLDVIKAPQGWDPNTIILICCDNLRLYSAKMRSEELKFIRERMKTLRFGNMVNQHREGYIVDQNNDFVVAVKAKGFLDVEGDTVFSRTVIMDGFSKVDKLGGISSIDLPYHERITKTSDNSAIGISTYSLRCGNGDVLTGRTIYPYVFDDDYPIDDLTLTVGRVESDLSSFRSGGSKASLSINVHQA